LLKRLFVKPFDKLRVNGVAVILLGISVPGELVMPRIGLFVRTSQERDFGHTINGMKMERAHRILM
jgi:hypothetical protein